MRRTRENEELHIGALDRRITIQQESINSGAFADPNDKTWSTFNSLASISAGFHVMSGSEIFRTQQFASRSNVVFVTRYIAGISNKMRISHSDPSMNFQYWQIEYVEPIGRKRFLRIYCYGLEERS